jgi:hypothetical protein
VDNDYQGVFKIGTHSQQLIDYALECDHLEITDFTPKKHLMITCLDQTNDKLYIDGSTMDWNRLKLKKFNSLITKTPIRSPEYSFIS